MMNRFASRFPAAVALAAAASMIATPAFAAQLPAREAPVAPIMRGVQADDGAVLHHSRGWGGYPGYGRYHRHRGGIDGGDVLAGVLVLGGIAAIAAAASNANKDRDYRDRDYRRDDYRYRQSQPDYPDQQDRYREGYDQGYSNGQAADDGGYGGASNDRQWNDDDYARARGAQGGYNYGM